MRNIRQGKPKPLALTSGAWLILDDKKSMKMLPSSPQITCITSRVSTPDKRSTLVRKAAVRC
jgi:predicted site-specific integrase-resolvase